MKNRIVDLEACIINIVVAEHRINEIKKLLLHEEKLLKAAQDRKADIITEWF